MIFSVMRLRFPASPKIALTLALFAAFPAAATKPPQLEKPLAGPRATVLRVTWLYISPDTGSQKVDRVQIGREMVVAEHSGSWLRVYANTDIEEEREKDAPLISSNEQTPPISGWMESRGVVIENTPNGDLVLMGEAANQESLAADPRGPINAAQSARLLYRRLTEMFPNSPLAAEAAWRAADIKWQLQKADASSRPSAHEKQAYLRDTPDEDEMKKIIRLYPHTRQEAFAAFELIDNKLCGDWEGQAKCPEKEAEAYEKYAEDFPDGPRTAQALYLAAYRMAVLHDMYDADGNENKSKSSLDHAKELATHLKEKFGSSDYAARAASLVYKLEEGIPVYGIDRERD